MEDRGCERRSVVLTRVSSVTGAFGIRTGSPGVAQGAIGLAAGDCVGLAPSWTTSERAGFRGREFIFPAQFRNLARPSFGHLVLLVAGVDFVSLRGSLRCGHAHEGHVCVVRVERGAHAGRGVA